MIKMKVKYVPKTGRIYQVKTSIGAEITGHNTLKAAKETAKEYTLNTGDEGYIYKCLGKMVKK